MLDLISAAKLPDVTEYLLGELDRLARAGADFAALAANTPHIVFDALCARSPVPLISIVEVTCEAARAKGLRRVGVRDALHDAVAFLPGSVDPVGNNGGTRS